MTEPTDNTEPKDAADTAATEAIPPVPPPSAQPAPPVMPPLMPYGPPPWSAQPFAPVVKEPWFNPAKRTSILVSAIVAGIVLLGGGVLIGLSAGHHDRRDRPGFTMYGPAGGQVIVPGNGQRPRFVLPGNGPRKVHPGNGQGNPNQSPVPSPSGSTTTS